MCKGPVCGVVMARALYRWSEVELRACKWWGRLPAPVGDIIPRRCPICRAPAVPLAGVGGRMVPRWPYMCEADYAAMEPGRLSGWFPKGGCVLVRCSQVLGWIREVCERQAYLRPVFETLIDVRFAAPYPAPAELPLALALPPWRGAEHPAVCPACRARRVETWKDCRFACGARYGWSAAHRRLVPASECPRPSLDHVLRVIRAKGAPWIGAACDRALAAYQKSVTVIDVFGSR